MRYVLRALLAGGLGLAVAFLVACGGGSGLLSTDQASGLNAQLDQVSSAVSSGQCANASNAANGFTSQVDGLSGQGVNPKLVANLRQGATVVSQLASRQCRQTTTTSSTTSSSPTTSSSSTTTSSPSSSSTTSSAPTSTVTPPSSTDTGSASTTTPTGGGGLGGGGNGGGTGGAGAGGGAP